MSTKISLPRFYINMVKNGSASRLSINPNNSFGRKTLFLNYRFNCEKVYNSFNELLIALKEHLKTKDETKTEADNYTINKDELSRLMRKHHRLTTTYNPINKIAKKYESLSSYYKFQRTKTEFRLIPVKVKINEIVNTNISIKDLSKYMYEVRESIESIHQENRDYINELNNLGNSVEKHNGYIDEIIDGLSDRGWERRTYIRNSILNGYDVSFNSKNPFIIMGGSTQNQRVFIDSSLGSERYLHRRDKELIDVKNQAFVMPSNEKAFELQDDIQKLFKSPKVDSLNAICEATITYTR